MLTAIILTTAIVIAVIIYSICKVSGRATKLEEEESYKWAVKWNNQRAIEDQWCDGKCLKCDADRCPFREVHYE